MNPQEYHRMDAEETTGWWFVGKRYFVHAILQEFGLSDPNAVILDAGCGTGALLRSLGGWRLAPPANNRRGDGDLHGLDPAPLALRLARRKCPAQLVCGTAERLPYQDGAFDLVLLLDVLEHLDDDEGALKEVHRVLKSGGNLLLTIPAFPCLWSDHDVALHHRRRYQRRQVEHLLRQASLQRQYLGCIYASVFPVAAAYRLWRRSHPAQHPKADVGTAPPYLNRFLCQLMKIEAQVARKVELPVGTSILALARKTR